VTVVIRSQAPADTALALLRESLDMSRSRFPMLDAKALSKMHLRPNASQDLGHRPRAPFLITLFRVGMPSYLSGVRSGTMTRRCVISILAAALFALGGVAPAQTPSTAEPAVGGRAGRPALGEWRPPNILLVLLDDVGFADASPFGGAIQMPNLAQLAQQGLTYTRFHVASMCSPTRASLLSGRNHHRLGFGRVTSLAGPEAGYNTQWPRESASVARVLRDNGYSTAAFGKWHNTPAWEISPVGPFDRWPTGLGFERFYGFMGGFDDHWSPNLLYRGTFPVEPPRSEGYHLTTDITDEAIRWLRQHDGLAPNRPWFLYFAPGAAHLPHHVPPEYIRRYAGRFDGGWDALRREIFERQKRLGIVPRGARLTPRPPGLPAWNSLSAEQRRLYARQMEVYAGFLEHTDHEIGRLLSTVNRTSDPGNTLIIYLVGDNGPEGGSGVSGSD
jgi:arylsulfatase A-like enzyme